MNAFPSEIILRLLQITYAEDNKTFTKLLRVCHQWQELGDPIQWKDIYIDQNRLTELLDALLVMQPSNFDHVRSITAVGDGAGREEKCRLYSLLFAQCHKFANLDTMTLDFDMYPSRNSGARLRYQLATYLASVPSTVKNLSLRSRYAGCGNDVDGCAHLCSYLRGSLLHLERLRLEDTPLCTDMIDLASVCETLREIVIINNEEHFTITNHVPDFPRMGPIQRFIDTARNAITRQRLPQLSKFLIYGRKNSPWEADELTLGYHWKIDLLHNTTTVWPHINCVPPKVWDKADGTQAYWMRYQEAPGSKIFDIADLSSDDGITRLIDGSSWSRSLNTGIELPNHQVKSRDYHEWSREDISIMLERSEQLKAYPAGHCHDLWFWEKCLGRRLIDVQFLDGTTLPDCPKREQPPAEKELVEMMARTSQFGDYMSEAV